jgi:esterase/lipase superfamily enzyme
MPIFDSPSILGWTLPQIAALLAACAVYGAVWLATRRLPGLARGLARAAPLVAILPAVVYVSLAMPVRHQLQAEETAARPETGNRAAKRDAAPTEPEQRSAKTAETPAPGGAASLPAPEPRIASMEGLDEAKRGAPAPAAVPGDWDLVPVFYGTDRVRTDGPKRIAYGAERARRLELGRALVSVPRSHQVPKIERPFAIRVPYFKVTLFEQAEDPKLHFTIQKLEALSRAEFLALARARLEKSHGFRHQAVVFVHGYNTRFENALYRTAQIAYDLQFDGAAFLYSWPSGGGVAGYGYDRESATQAEPYLRDFLSMVVRETGAKGVSVIAHSMGNLPLLSVLRELGPALPRGVRLNEIILAAPDVDRDVFANLAADIRRYGRGITLYCSANDRAMAASRQFAGGVPRAGDVPPGGPIVMPGIDTIDVSQTSTDLLALNHSAYAEKSALLNDIGLLLQTGERPPERRIPILQKVPTPAGSFWRYP